LKTTASRHWRFWERWFERLCENTPVRLTFALKPCNNAGISHLRGTDRGEVQRLPPCLDDYVAGVDELLGALPAAA